MPTYDYMCDSCRTAFEVQHKMADNPVIVCPRCGQSAHQVFSAGFGLNFTGKGFYQTDTQKTTAPAHTEKNDVQATPSQTNDKPTHSCSGGCGCLGSSSCSS